MSLTTRVLIGLVAGFVLGLALAGSPSPAVSTLLAVVAPVGTIFVNLIRMTVIPLVASMLVASVGSLASSGTLGRTGARAAVIAVVTLTITATATVLIATPVLSRIQIDQAAALALRGPAAPTSAATAAGSPSVAQWFVDLVSPNVVKAAADGAMLPVILFSVLFGMALAGVAAPSGATPCCGSRRGSPMRCSAWSAASSSWRRLASSRWPCRWPRSSVLRRRARWSPTSRWSWR